MVLRGHARPPPGHAFTAPPPGGDCRDLLWPALYRGLRGTPTDRGRAASDAGTVAGRSIVVRCRAGRRPMPYVGVHGFGRWQRGGAPATAADGHGGGRGAPAHLAQRHARRAGSGGGRRGPARAAVLAVVGEQTG